jgi:hypothetical protein
MIARPKTIQIFLPAGDPRGIRIAEITTRIVQVKDHLFKTPSAASYVVLGQSSNGWIDWKSAAGETLDTLKRQKVTA